MGAAESTAVSTTSQELNAMGLERRRTPNLMGVGRGVVCFFSITDILLSFTSGADNS